MSRLDTILNPEVGHPSGVRSPESSSSSTTPFEPIQYVPRLPEAMDEKTHDHPEHPDCPDTLACLPDTDGRPQHTLPIILRCAIMGSKKKRLTIREIYAAMEEKYPYYRTAGITWKQSVRHHLSLNRLFERQPRPVTDPGFGSYWTVNLDAPPGTKRPRKRGRPMEEGEEAPAPKKRGRPRKAAPHGVYQTAASHGMEHPPIATLSLSSMDQHPTSSGKAPSRPPSSMLRYPDDEDEDMFYDAASRRSRTEDDYDSEDDVHRHYPRTFSPLPSRMLSPPPPPPMPGYNGSQVVSRGWMLNASRHDEEAPENTIDKLRIEMATLRKQANDALAMSISATDQLSQAHAEASRAKVGLRTAEQMLDAETRRRREAERVADEEIRKRKEVEAELERLRKHLKSVDVESEDDD